MITQLDILNFKAHRAVRIPLSNYQLFVGPNGTGKSTAFDAILFVHNALNESIEYALDKTNAESLIELTHCGRGDSIGFSFALQKEGWPALRYTTLFRQDPIEGVVVDAESVAALVQGKDISIPGATPDTQLSFELFERTDEFEELRHLKSHATRNSEAWKRIVYRTTTGADTYKRIYDDASAQDSYAIQTNLAGPKQFTLKFLPFSPGFEYANWIKEYLLKAPSRIQLDIESIRLSGAPGKSGSSLSDNGDNFANVVATFESTSKDSYRNWIRHINEYFPEISGIQVEVKPEDKRRVFYVVTREGTKVPHYLLSDGTLRFMALTLLAYHENGSRFLMIEEPENGLHPTAIEGVLEPFKSVDPKQQVAFASHS
ncbi:AAA family ATPase, partial [bacterium]|nr:AAA family ATPase [bacterium]